MEPIRTFVEYQQPLRCKRTAMAFASLFAVSGLTYAAAAFFVLNSPDERTPIGVAALFIGSGLSIGIVCFIVGCVQAWAFITAQIHEVRITNEGIKYDGKVWLWNSVTSIRSTTTLPNGAAYLFVRVKRGPLRSRLTLAVEIRGDEAHETINELRQFLIDIGSAIPWRSRAV